MSPELIAILAVGVALAGIVITAQHTTRADFNKKLEAVQSDISGLRDGIGNLRERMAKLEGLLEGLREAISGKRDAA